MNYNFERIKLGWSKILNNKALFLIPILYFLLLFIGFQAATNLLALASSPTALLPIAKILWACIVFCAFMGLLVLFGTPHHAKKYERGLSSVFSKVASNSSSNSAPLAILISIEKTERGIILDFFSDSLSIDKYKEHQSDLEAALNLIIVEICRGKKGVRHVLIKALPGDYKQPHIIPWDDSYLSHEGFTLVLGQTPFGLETIDLATTPHLLYGGGSGSGKSQLVKLSAYESIMLGATVYIYDGKGGLDFPPFFHKRCEIITNKQQFLAFLERIIPSKGSTNCEKDDLSIMDKRREVLLASHSCDVTEHNQHNCKPYLPRILIIVDELAEVLDKTGLSKEEKEEVGKIESALSTIARLGRALGVHLLLSTQRPDSEIIRGQIKANIGYKCCGRSDKILSQIILDDASAAEKISPDSQGLFCTNMGTMFKAFYLDDDQLE